MDWITIGMVGGVGLVYSLTYLVLSYTGMLDYEDTFLNIFITFIVTAFIIVGVTLLVALFINAGHALYQWGGLNTLAVIGVLLLTMGVPLFGKSMIVKAIVIPHFVKQCFANLRKEQLAYKAEVEERFPIKRSVYELIGDDK